jgi:hypothetical protein
MLLPISDAVLCGEIDNRTRNSVLGWIRLRGLRHPLMLRLTGNCCEDLLGCCLRFEVTDKPPFAEDAAEELPDLAPHQIGPVGSVTTIGKVLLADCSPGELVRCAECGEPPPVSWKQGLFLEWYGQNGRVVVELLDAKLTCIAAPSFEIPGDEFVEEADDDDEMDADEDEDPFGLFPDDLDDQLAAELDVFDETDRGPDLTDEQEVGPDEVPLSTLFDPPMKLFPPELLTNLQIEESLQVVLARLARHGVGLDMCEHFSPRQAYRLLLEQLLPAESVAAGLVESGCVQRFSTQDFCSACLGQFAMGDVDADAPRDAPADEEG